MVNKYVEITIFAILLILLIVFGVFSAYLRLEVVELKDQIQNLGNAYDRLYENFELVLSVINPPLTPISKTDSISIALKQMGLNETALQHIDAYAALYFVRFYFRAEENQTSQGFEMVCEVREPSLVYR
jgi:Mn2+/Fe2+ NRAMP family transporter